MIAKSVWMDPMKDPVFLNLLIKDLKTCMTSLRKRIAQIIAPLA